MKLRTKFLVMLFLPLAGLLLFGTQNVLEKWAVSTNMGDMEQLTGFAVQISAIVHETQKERGATAGFLGSRGVKFTSELPAQRQKTDEHISKLRNHLKIFDATAFDHAFHSELSKALEILDHISQIRGQVDDQQISVTEAIGFYSRMNAAFLTAIAQMTKLAVNVEMASLSGAYVHFLQGKELAGIERAVMNNTFSHEAFAPGGYRRFSQLVYRQETLFGGYQELAADAEVAFFKKKMGQPVVAEVRRMREIAFKKGVAGDNSGFGVDSTYWYRTITEKINLLKQVEDRLSDALAKRAIELKNKADLAFWGYLISTLAVVAIVIGFGIVIVRQILRQLGGEPVEVMEVAERVARGDLSITFDTSRKLTGIYAAMKQMVEQLSEMVGKIHAGKARNQAIVETASDCIITIDSRGVISSVNPSTEKTFGYTAEEMIGQNVSLLMPEPDKSHHDGYLDRYFQNGRKRVVGKITEVVGQRKDGTIVPLFLSVAEVKIEGSTTFCGILRDLTQEKLFQAQLLQSGKLAGIGTLATGIAHELRQPLAVMRLTAEDTLALIEDEDEEFSVEEVSAVLQKLIENCTRMTNIVDHLRTFAREEEGQILENIDLGTVLESSFTLINAQFRSRGIEIKKDVAENIPSIRGNANQLEQVLVNLLSNARDALEGVDDPAIKINIRQINRRLFLTLADNGPGVPQEIQTKIFDPFFTTKEAGKGTGLGMSISLGIITNHGGTITVSDTECGGAKFTIILPVAEEK